MSLVRQSHSSFISAQASTSLQCYGPKVCCICFCCSTFKMGPRHLFLKALDRNCGAFKSIQELSLGPDFKLRMQCIRKQQWAGAIFSSVEHYKQPSTFMYIGSTSQSVFRRESNRMSVAKKLTSGKEAQAELSIRFWVSNNSLQDYILFLVTPCASYREAWVTEHRLIGMST